MQKYQILKDILSRKMISKYNIKYQTKKLYKHSKKKTSLVLAEKQIHELMKQKSHT